MFVSVGRGAWSPKPTRPAMFVCERVHSKAEQPLSRCWAHGSPKPLCCRGNLSSTSAIGLDISLSGKLYIYIYDKHAGHSAWKGRTHTHARFDLGVWSPYRGEAPPSSGRFPLSGPTTSSTSALVSMGAGSWSRVEDQDDYEFQLDHWNREHWSSRQNPEAPRL